MSPLESTTLGRIAARGDLSASLTAIVADDSVKMVEWWAARGVATPIDGDDLARVKVDRQAEKYWTDKSRIFDRTITIVRGHTFTMPSAQCAHTPKRYADGVCCEFCGEAL